MKRRSKPVIVHMTVLEAELVEVALRELGDERTEALREKLARKVHDIVIGKVVRRIIVRPLTPIIRSREE